MLGHRTESSKKGLSSSPGVLVDHNDQEFKGFFKMGKLDYWIDDR